MRTLALLALLTAAGCGDPVVRFADLEDDAYVGGLQVTRLALDAPSGVEHAELYLDGLRLADALRAPFDLAWDTRLFPEGPHRLGVRIDLANGDHASASVAIHIDNTAPTLGARPAYVVYGEPVVLAPADNGKLARLEVTARAPEPKSVAATAPPFEPIAPWSCGALELEVVVVDAAGNELRETLPVTSADPADIDCDHHRAADQRGDDCDDFDPEIHPGAPEHDDQLDRDCDGLVGAYEGIDADGDGVPSLASGGHDCNDADPAIHGRFLVLRDHVVETRDGVVAWAPGEASLAGLGAWELYLDRDGAIDRVRPDRTHPGADRIERIATGANPRSIASASDTVVFGRGNTVEVWRVAGGSWTQASTLTSDAPIGALAYVPPSQGAEYLAFQAGTRVWFAANHGAGWHADLVADAEAPLAEPPLLAAAPALARVAFHTTTAAWLADRFGDTDPLQLRSLGTGVVTGLASQSNLLTLTAFERPDGHLVFGGPMVATLPARPAGMVMAYPYLYVQLTGGDLIALDFEDGFRRVQHLPGIGSFDASTHLTFARGGHVFEPAPQTVDPVRDPIDGVDRDCDGRD